MKDLTITEKETLLNDVKSFLNITWEDDETDIKLWRMIASAMRRIDDIAGCELDYLIDEDTEGEALYLSMSFIGRDLMFNRVFYDNEKGLDDFEPNFVGSLVDLYLKGKAYASTQTED